MKEVERKVEVNGRRTKLSKGRKNIKRGVKKNE